MTPNEIVRAAFDRLPDLITAAVEDLTPDQLRWRPKLGANTIAWLVWHLTRIQDSHLAELLDADQVYLTGGSQLVSTTRSRSASTIPRT